MGMSLPSPALVVACVALLFAAGGVSYAATGSAVNIVDPVTTTNLARVDSSGRLAVGDGSGPLTVDGTVFSRPSAPLSPWFASKDIQTPPGVLITGPSSVPIDVTSLSISTDDTSGASDHVFLYGEHVPSTATTCNGATYDTALWVIRDAGDGVTPVAFTFPTPLQYRSPPGTKACLAARALTPAVTTMNASGFYGS